MRRNSSGKYGVAAIIVSAIVVLGAAFAVRHGLLESGVLPRDCSLAEAHRGLCVFKTVLVESFLQQRVGWFSLACGLCAFALGCRRLAWAGWLSGLAGLVFYSYDPAAVGGLLSLFVLARPRKQQGQGEHQTGEQPGDGLRVRRLG